MGAVEEIVPPSQTFARISGLQRTAQSTPIPMLVSTKSILYRDILSWAGYVVVLTDLTLLFWEIAAILRHIFSIILVAQL
jgi:hypothetical protein